MRCFNSSSRAERPAAVMGNLLIGSCFDRGATKSRYGHLFGHGDSQRQSDQVVILTKPLKAERAGARRTPSRAPARNAMPRRRSVAAARASTAAPGPTRPRDLDGNRNQSE